MKEDSENDEFDEGEILFHGSILHPRYIRKISLLMEFGIAINVLTVLIGIIVHYSFKDVHVVKELGRSDGRSTSNLDELFELGQKNDNIFAKLFLLSGQTFFVLLGLAGLFIYHGSQLWQWTLAFIGANLGSASFFIWVNGVGNSHCSDDLAETITLFCVFDISSLVSLTVAILHLHLFKGNFRFKIVIFFGVYLLLVAFPIASFLAPFGPAGLTFLVLGTACTVPSYAIARLLTLSPSSPAPSCDPFLEHALIPK